MHFRHDSFQENTEENVVYRAKTRTPSLGDKISRASASALINPISLSIKNGQMTKIHILLDKITPCLMKPKLKI